MNKSLERSRYKNLNGIKATRVTERNSNSAGRLKSNLSTKRKLN